MIYFLNCFLQSESGAPVFRDPSVVDLFPSFGDAYAAGKQFFHCQIDLLKEDDLSREEWMTSGWSYLFDIREYSPDCEWKREWMFRFDGQPLHSRWVLYQNGIGVEAPCAQVPGILLRRAQDYHPGDLVLLRQKYGVPLWSVVVEIVPCRNASQTFPEADGSFWLSGLTLKEGFFSLDEIDPCQTELPPKTAVPPPDLLRLSEWIRSGKPLWEPLFDAAFQGLLCTSDLVRIGDLLA